MSNKNNANIGFEKQIWDAACVLWGHIPAAEYRKVIIGLIFLRYISNAFEKRYKELVAEGDGFEDVFSGQERYLFQGQVLKGRGRGVLLHRPGRDHGSGGGVGLRQDHRGADDFKALRGHGRLHCI